MILSIMVELLNCAYNLHTRQKQNVPSLNNQMENVLFLYRLLCYNTIENNKKKRKLLFKIYNNNSELNRKHSIHLKNEIKKTTLTT